MPKTESTFRADHGEGRMTQQTEQTLSPATLPVGGPDAEHHANVVPGRRTDRRTAHEDVPDHQGSGDRRDVELRDQQEDPALPTAPRRLMALAAVGRRSRAGIPQMYRVLPVPGRLPCAAHSRAQAPVR